MERKYKDDPLPYFVVEAAVQGDAEAIQEVLACYRAYICKLCTQPFYDEYGNVHYIVNQDMAEQVESMLVRAIVMNFKLDYDSNL